jgi:hypothetical protein
MVGSVLKLPVPLAEIEIWETPPTWKSHNRDGWALATFVTLSFSAVAAPLVFQVCAIDSAGVVCEPVRAEGPKVASVLAGFCAVVCGVLVCVPDCEPDVLTAEPPGVAETSNAPAVRPAAMT